MAYFMLIVDFSYALQAVMNIIMILLNNYFFEFALLHTSILLISFLFYKKNLLELATCKKVITCHEQSPIQTTKTSSQAHSIHCSWTKPLVSNHLPYTAVGSLNLGILGEVWLYFVLKYSCLFQKSKNHWLKKRTSTVRRNPAQHQEWVSLVHGVLVKFSIYSTVCFSQFVHSNYHAEGNKIHYCRFEYQLPD